jgi:hypothetical protein
MPDADINIFFSISSQFLLIQAPSHKVIVIPGAPSWVPSVLKPSHICRTPRHPCALGTEALPLHHIFLVALL